VVYYIQDAVKINFKRERIWAVRCVAGGGKEKRCKNCWNFPNNNKYNMHDSGYSYIDVHILSFSIHKNDYTLCLYQSIYLHLDIYVVCIYVYFMEKNAKYYCASNQYLFPNNIYFRVLWLYLTELHSTIEEKFLCMSMMDFFCVFGKIVNCFHYTCCPCSGGCMWVCTHFLVLLEGSCGRACMCVGMHVYMEISLFWYSSCICTLN